MRDKVLRMLEIYAEGDSAQVARDAVGLSGRDFYRALREHPDLKILYYDLQKDAADMLVDQTRQISTDESLNPRVARVMAEIRLKVAAAYDRKRFGDKVQLEVDAGPNLQAALEAAKSRVMLPPRDLKLIKDAEYIEITQQINNDATDQQSVDQPSALPPGVPDPFED